MAGILDGSEGRSLTTDEVTQYESLETEMCASRDAAIRSTGQAGGEAAGGEGGDGAGGAGEGTDGQAASAQTSAQLARQSALIRQRNEAYNTVIIPAGVGRTNRPQETIDAPFRAYLRSGRPNADITGLAVNGPEDLGIPRPQNAQGESTGPAGGYLVPEGFRTKIVERMKSVGGLEPETEQLVTESGQNLPWPTIDDTANQGEVVDEGAANAGGADFGFDFQDLGAYEYQAGGTGGLPLKLPWTLMQDAAFDVEGLLSRLLGVRLQRTFAPHLLIGNGVKQPKGILNGVTGTQTAASTIGYADLLAAMTTPDQLYWPNAKWLMNQTSLGLVWGIKDSQNRPIWIPGLMAGDQGAGPTKGSLLGYPVALDNGMPNFVGTGGSTTNWCVFGDLRAGYVTRKVRDIAVVVNPWSSASKRQNEYTAWMRADGRPQDTNAFTVIAGKA